MSTYRTPSINGMTLVIVTGWLVINSMLFLATNSLSEHSETQVTTNATLRPPQMLTTHNQSWLAGVVLGTITFISWLASSIESSFVRFSTRITMAIGCVFLLTVCCTPDILRHAISVSGILLMQPIIFVILAIPCWTISRGGVAQPFRLNKVAEASQPPKLRQFHVGEIITLTTLVAMLLAASRHYTPPVASLVYWPVLTCSWFLLQTIAGLTIRVVMFRQLRLLMFLLPAIFLTPLGLATAQSFVSEGSSQTKADLSLYSFLIVGFTLSIAVLCSSDGGENAQKLNDPRKSDQNQASS